MVTWCKLIATSNCEMKTMLDFFFHIKYSVHIQNLGFLSWKSKRTHLLSCMPKLFSYFVFRAPALSPCAHSTTTTALLSLAACTPLPVSLSLSMVRLFVAHDVEATQAWPEPTARGRRVYARLASNLRMQLATSLYDSLTRCTTFVECSAMATKLRSFDLELALS